MAMIVLGVSSSISIYKACEIVRGFQRKEHSVQVIMTPNAANLVSPLLFSALSGQKAIVDPFTDKNSDRIAHVDMAKETALLAVAPATANIIGKFASGVADDFLSTFYMVVGCPVLIAPAMNEAMYFHKQTQENIQKLKSLGVVFIEPEKGYLACQDEGWGRLAPPEKIVELGLMLIVRSGTLKGRTVLVTAGPTREHLDPVRFLSNRSSGKMGYALAEEALRRGAEVVLISGPSTLHPPRGAEFVYTESARDMSEAVQKFFAQADIVLMAAAVSDFAFPAKAAQKIKKKETAQKVELVRTPDILAQLGREKKGKILIGFAAETEHVLTNAKEKIRSKNLDLIVANDIAKPDIGFDSDMNEVTLVFSDGRTLATEKRSKAEISRIILDEVEALIAEKP